MSHTRRIKRTLRRYLAPWRAGPVIIALLVLFAGIVAVSHAAARPLQVSLNSGTAYTFSTSGGSPTAHGTPIFVNTGGVGFTARVTIDVGGTGAAVWTSTSYQFLDGTATIGTAVCVNHADFNTDGSFVDFPLTAPATSGVYGIRFIAYNTTQDCTSGNPITVNVYSSVNVGGANPTAAPGCGFSMGIILDESYSIFLASGGVNGVRSGLMSLINALNGTGTEVSLVEFNSAARYISGLGPRVVNASAVTDYNNYANSSFGGASYDPGSYAAPNYYTNWQDAFLTQRTAVPNYSSGPAGLPSDPPDFLLFFTDGDPTIRNGGAFANDEASWNGLNLTTAVTEANLIKAQGTRIIGIGVGSIASSQGSINRLKSVSGPIQAGANPNPLTDDVIITANFDALSTIFRNLALSLCGSSLTITKEVPGAQPNTWVPAPGWDFTADVDLKPPSANNAYVWQVPLGATPGSPTPPQTTNVNGTVTFQWQPNSPPADADVVIDEVVKPNYLMQSVTCQEQRLDGNTYPVTVNNLNLVNGTFDIDLTNAAIGTCTVRNVPASLTITKQGPTFAKPGTPFNYTINYTNNGYLPLTNVTLTDVLPNSASSQMSVLSVVKPPTPVAVTCAPLNTPNTTVTCTGLDDLDPGESGTVVLQVVVNAPNAQEDNLTNTACITGVYSPGLTVGLSPQICSDITTTTPVTVSYFAAEAGSGGTRFTWSTASESANAGFNLYMETGNGLEQINDLLIPSAVIDSRTPQDYSFDAPGVTGDTFYIEDVGLFGEDRLHGPFTAGEIYGERIAVQPIDWAAIAAESAAVGAGAESLLPAAMTGEVEPEQTLALAAGPAAVELRVTRSGIYRLTYEQIMAATGVDLRGTSRTALALTNRGQPVPFFMSKFRFGPGAFIEFVGEGLDTLYTDTNVYRLEVNRGLNELVAIQRTRPTRAMIRADRLPSHYMETATVESNLKYSTLSASDDPWFMADLVALAPNASWPFTINLDNFVPDAAAESTFNMTVWGMSDAVAGPDHHLLASLNGSPLADMLYDGNELVELSVPLAGGVLVEGANQLTLTKPLDRGAPRDYSGLESYEVIYPRAFVARDGRLAFEGEAQAYRVTNLPSRSAVVYRQSEGGRLVKLTGLVYTPGPNGTWEVAFRGMNGKAKYFVSTVPAVEAPQVAVARAPGNLTSGQAELLVIAHPNFIAGLTPWVQARQADYSVKVVDVRDIYVAYSGGVFDAGAIAEYIRFAIRTMGTEYVALIGGDTTDYRNYSGAGSISFIPSLYAHTMSYINYAPVDPLYTDVNGDRLPDAAIGRFPVRTAAELDQMIDKILQYDARANIQTAIFASDDGFERDSDSFADPLTGWAIEKAYAGENTNARSALIAALNQGPRLTSFVGHSAANGWTFTGLFTSADAANLTNYDKPTLVTQWGCWNTYYVDPALDTLGHKFLLSGSPNGTIGAAVITGSTTLTRNTSERALGDLMMPRLMTPGTPVGAAMQAAKAELAATKPGLTDVLLGWTVLGDPTVVVRP